MEIPQKESSKKKGDKGEDLAAQYLTEKGYSIREKNWIHERYELDLIAETLTHLVIVEVKTRYSDVYGEPWEAVNKAKRKKICKSGDAYIRQFNIEKEPRFDIVSIIKMNGTCRITHIEDAFWPFA
jgi:putative endonuclease